MGESRVHPSAVVEPGARLGDGVQVGALCYIGADVDVGAGSVFGTHCSVHGPTRIGRDNRFVGQLTSSLGLASQIFHEILSK